MPVSTTTCLRASGLAPLQMYLAITPEPGALTSALAKMPNICCDPAA